MSHSEYVLADNYGTFTWIQYFCLWWQYCRLCIYCVLFPPPLPGSTWGEAGRWDGSGGAVSPLSCTKNNTTAEGAGSLPYPTILSQQLPSALVMWLTDSSGELLPSPTVMAVSGSREDGVNSTAATSWFRFLASCWTVPAVIRDFTNTPQAAVLPTMADRGVDLSALPKEVRDQLAELDLELSEGKLSILRV